MANAGVPIEATHLKRLAVYGLRILALAVLYHLTARIGLRMAYVQINTSPVWPPMGIAVAALLIFGFRMWPGITLGVLLGSLLSGASAGIAIGLSIGNTLEALICVTLLKRLIGFHSSIDRIDPSNNSGGG